LTIVFNKVEQLNVVQNIVCKDNCKIKVNLRPEKFGGKLDESELRRQQKQYSR